MSNSRIAPIRPSIARYLKRQIGGFIREYERAVNGEAEPAESPEPERRAETPPAATRDEETDGQAGS